MKLGAAIPVLNEWRFMRAVTGQLLRIVDRCVVLRGRRSFSGAPVELTEPSGLDSRVEVMEGTWSSEEETRAAGMRTLADCDYVIGIDSDEILLDAALDRLVALCRSGLHPVIGVRCLTYWKSPDYRIDPPETGVIRMVLRRDVRTHGLRGVDGSVFVSDVVCHHLSYVRTDEELREKVRLFSHAHEIRPGWYEDVWRAWDRNTRLENLHPTDPPAYRRAVHEPNRELTALLARWECWP